MTNQTVGFGDPLGSGFAGMVLSGSVMDCPEANAILRELNERVATLESIVASISCEDVDGVPPQNPAAAVTVTITQKQRLALEGLPSNVSGLVRCLERRRNEEPRKTTRGSATLQRRATTIISDERRASVNIPVIPKELLLGMDSPPHANSPFSSTAASTAAHLAHEYGGVALPKRFTEKKTQRRSLKVFARALSRANSFVGQAKIEANFGKDELEYLPREFTRLGPKERKRLTEMLSWKGLKSWGLDTFEVDRLSTVTVFRRGSSKRLLDPDEGERERENEGDNQGESSEGEEDCVEGSRQGCPLVLMGWALLSSPYSQLAMAKNVKDEELTKRAYKAIRQRANTLIGRMAQRMVREVEGESQGNGKTSRDESEEKETARTSNETKESDPSRTDEEDDDIGGYFVPDEFGVEPRAVCHFLRRVEREYRPRGVNPYHNNIHGADVMQTTHALIQMAGRGMRFAYTPLEIYSTLLAAALHDVRHPGNNNNYEVNKMTELSLRYHEKSVLENMHACRASHLLEGLEEGGAGRRGSATSLEEKGGGAGIAGSMTKEQRRTLRTSVAGSILSTDMSRHFSEMAEMKRLLEALEDDREGGGRSPGDFLARLEGGDHRELRERFLPLLLHLADISNPAKPRGVSVEWSNAVYDEFFQQGDREAAEDLPVSPLCDRSTTVIPEAQLGFMNFVVRPAFALLGRCIPRVNDAVMGELEENFRYWTEQKEMQNDDRTERKDSG